MPAKVMKKPSTAKASQQISLRKRASNDANSEDHEDVAMPQVEDIVVHPPVGMEDEGGRHDAPAAVHIEDAPPADHTPAPATPEDTPGAAGSTGPMQAVSLADLALTPLCF
eukprot:4952057-Amphidinium_carterae.1